MVIAEQKRTNVETGWGLLQYPVNDVLFMEIVEDLEACFDRSEPYGCYRCEIKTKCLKIFSGLSERCSDQPLDKQSYIQYSERFKEIQEDHKKTIREGSQIS